MVFFTITLTNNRHLSLSWTPGALMVSEPQVSCLNGLRGDLPRGFTYNSTAFPDPSLKGIGNLEYHVSGTYTLRNQLVI
jgi:hypothetical protein